MSAVDDDDAWMNIRLELRAVRGDLRVVSDRLARDGKHYESAQMDTINKRLYGVSQKLQVARNELEQAAEQYHIKLEELKDQGSAPMSASTSTTRRRIL